MARQELVIKLADALIQSYVQRLRLRAEVEVHKARQRGIISAAAFEYFDKIDLVTMDEWLLLKEALKQEQDDMILLHIRRHDFVRGIRQECSWLDLRMEGSSATQDVKLRFHDLAEAHTHG